MKENNSKIMHLLKKLLKKYFFRFTLLLLYRDLKQFLSLLKHIFKKYQIFI